MKVVVSIDSLKGSLSSEAAGEAVKKAILAVDPTSSVQVFPLADGGEGTVQAMHSVLGGELVKKSVTGPLGTPVSAEYCILPDGTAVVEVASAAGLPLVPQEKRDPLVTTSYGVGEVILDAVSRGCRNIVVGLGGSATCDGGVGMLAALGYEFLDENQKKVPLGGRGLETLAFISAEKVSPVLSECRFLVASDVKNPLVGPLGAAAVFGPQKGLSYENVEIMDAWLAGFARLTKDIFPHADSSRQGAGAAGGLGFAFLSYLGAELREGAGLILEKTKAEEAVSSADLVVTGEGRLDRQTAMGKAPGAVAALAKKFNKPVVAFCGVATSDAESCNENGIDAYFPILHEIISEKDAMSYDQAYDNLYRRAVQVFRLICAVRGS